jgi:hypothetical protein
MMLWLALLPILLLALGIAVLVRGLRGRRMDDHPICRKCGFDLIGRPAGSDRCPECGSDLDRPHAIQDGRRVRQRGLIATGSFLILFVLANAIFAAWVVFPQIAWRQYAPVWYLRHEANGVDLVARDKALAELLRRMSASKLSQAQIDALAEDALATQADFNKSWISAWGDVIESAQDANKLSPDQLARYLEMAMDSAVSLNVPPQLERGAPVQFTLRASRARVSDQRTIVLELRARSAHVGQFYTERTGMPGNIITLSNSAASADGNGYAVLSMDQADRLKDGPNDFVLHLEVKFRRERDSATFYPRNVDLKSRFTLVPAGSVRAKLNRYRSLAEQRARTTTKNSTTRSWKSPAASNPSGHPLPPD